MLCRAEHGFDKGVVITHTWPRVGRLMPSQCGIASTVVALKGALLSPYSTGRWLPGWAATPSVSAVRCTKRASWSALSPIRHFPADYLATVQIHDQEQVQSSAGPIGRQVRHVPALHLAGCGGNAGGWCACATAVTAPSMRAQHPLEAGFAGDIALFVSQHGRDACWRHVRESCRIDDLQRLKMLGVDKRMRRCWTCRHWVAIAAVVATLSALQCAEADPAQATGFCEVGASMACLANGAD